MVGCPVWLVWWLLVKTDDSVFYGSNNNVSMDGNETWLPCLGVSWCVLVCRGVFWRELFGTVCQHKVCSCPILYGIWNVLVGIMYLVKNIEVV
jgi:hypothetical protein